MIVCHNSHMYPALGSDVTFWLCHTNEYIPCISHALVLVSSDKSPAWLPRVLTIPGKVDGDASHRLGDSMTVHVPLRSSLACQSPLVLQSHEPRLLRSIPLPRGPQVFFRTFHCNYSPPSRH